MRCSRSAEVGWSRATRSRRRIGTASLGWSRRPSPSQQTQRQAGRRRVPTMVDLVFRSAQDCRYDAIALGEVMLRFDPGEGRIRTARSFRVWEGGGEYNVARGLRRCFGMSTAVVTAFADNEIGRLV